MPTSQQQYEDFIYDIVRLTDLVDIKLKNIYLKIHDTERQFVFINELNDNTLSELGKSEWSDVLNGIVEAVGEVDDGLNIELSGVDPERLQEFTNMLSGDVPKPDYEKSLNQGNQPSENDSQINQQLM